MYLQVSVIPTKCTALHFTYNVLFYGDNLISLLKLFLPEKLVMVSQHKCDSFTHSYILWLGLWLNGEGISCATGIGAKIPRAHVKCLVGMAVLHNSTFITQRY